MENSNLLLSMVNTQSKTSRLSLIFLKFQSTSWLNSNHKSCFSKRKLTISICWVWRLGKLALNVDWIVYEEQKCVSRILVFPWVARLCMFNLGMGFMVPQEFQSQWRDLLWVQVWCKMTLSLQSTSIWITPLLGFSFTN